MKLDRPELELYLSAEEHRFAQRYLAQRGVAEGDLLIALHPGGEGFYGKKRWPWHGFVQVGRELVRRHGARLLILGGDDERHLASQVATGIGRGCINGAGTTTIRETAALVERCHLFIGNDSSPLHIATALKKPVVAIFGPSSADNFRPYGVKHGVVRKSLPCSPCFHFIGSIPFWQRPFCRHPRCLHQITAAEVVAAAESLLPSPAPKSRGLRSSTTVQEGGKAINRSS